MTPTNSVIIKVRKNGPYLVTGTVTLTDHEGNPIEVEENFVLCRCGHSRTKPFCDSSHKRVGFNDEDHRGLRSPYPHG